MASISPERFSSYRKQRGLTQEDFSNQLGITAKYVGMLERGEKQVEEASSLGLLFQLREQAPFERPAIKREPLNINIPDPVPIPAKHVPVIGWAHAGESASYEELPKSWADQVPTECRDPKAFAVRLEGDSMEPSFREGDLLIVMPSQEPYSGCFVVCRFKDDGVVFRRLETTGTVIRLVPLNERYPVSEHTAEEFSWIYPVWGRFSQLWKRRAR